MSEGARITRVEEGIRSCMKQSALDRARALYGTSCQASGSSCSTAPAILSQETPLESDALARRVAACGPGVVGPIVVPESIRIQRILQQTLEQSIDPTDPDARFSEYRGPYIPPVCPPIPQEITNAFLPKASTKCPLPNKPWNPAFY